MQQRQRTHDCILSFQLQELCLQFNQIVTDDDTELNEFRQSQIVYANVLMKIYVSVNIDTIHFILVSVVTSLFFSWYFKFLALVVFTCKQSKW